ncbi:MAG: type IX secretion system sortase PorU [Chitinophagaceae bacterium]|nr:type IX secretion system sortase PorU [Chitinophagaceae bacterium]
MYRNWLYIFLVLLQLFGVTDPAAAQRAYAANSVLSTGDWYKLSTSREGVYKIDAQFLNSLGINSSVILSNSIRLFGNGGRMLSESNAGLWLDDLFENPIQVFDGGDGIFNGTDYLLFYAGGANKWEKDSVNQLFIHKKNIYTDKTYYFITVGGTGKRIATAPLISSPGTTVTGFSERYFHELDSINFLASGKEWYGEEFANAPGKSLTKDFVINGINMQAGTPIKLNSRLVSRSVGYSSGFNVKINGQPAGQFSIAATGAGTYDVFAVENSFVASGVATTADITINYSYVPGGFNAQGWLNYFELFFRRNLSLSGTNQLAFRDWQTAGSNNVAEFVISNATAGSQVWDITDPLTPQQMQGLFSGTELRVKNSSNVLREYIAFNNTGFFTPFAESRISNQNLHNISPADLIIVTYTSLLPQAERLGALHRQHDGMKVVVVTTDQIYNEFSSGSPDPAAIRDFVKMYYDRYRNSANSPEHLLLFGDASYDYKNRLQSNTNLVPAWENGFSLDPLSTYASDDFFGFLDDNDDINSGTVINLLDIGIGRVPAKNITEAKNFVDKVDAYFSAAGLAPWRHTITFVADDEDNNLHLQDAESITATATLVNPEFNQQKIYLDAYKQETGPGGSNYPKVIEANNSQLFNGTLIWNFNGHGGALRLAEETILDQQIVNGWNNASRLPLFITATCDFAPYDNPAIHSLGENILLRPQTGAIALMTTTRLVFAFGNRIMNDNYIRFALEPLPGGKYRTLVNAVKTAKNFTYQNSADISNNRKFTLLGDPALTLAFPAMKTRITTVNGNPVSVVDTLSAGEKVTIAGEIVDSSGNLVTGFNGKVYPLLLDKPQTVFTLANDPGSQVTGFQTQNQVLFKGQAFVKEGKFTFTFRMPKDVSQQYGFGKISLYAEDGLTDASGIFTGFLTGGTSASQLTDKEGPGIKLFLNDELFVNGGITNQQPVLIAKFNDSSGINTAGAGIGHDIVATLDNDSRQFFILNDFYQGDMNDYQSGVLRFELPVLQPGTHSLKLKAWDIMNNSGEAQIDFMVTTDEELQISHVLNYPNPFTKGTNFWFEHNKPGQPLRVQIQVITLTGKVVKSLSEEIITDGNRSASVFGMAKTIMATKLAGESTFM